METSEVKTLASAGYYCHQCGSLNSAYSTIAYHSPNCHTKLSLIASKKKLFNPRRKVSQELPSYRLPIQAKRRSSRSLRTPWRVTLSRVQKTNRNSFKTQMSVIHHYRQRQAKGKVGWTLPGVPQKTPSHRMHSMTSWTCLSWMSWILSPLWNTPLRGKVPGEDFMLPETIKCRKPALLEQLNELLCLCREEGKEPQDMRNAKITTVQKQRWQQ